MPAGIFQKIKGLFFDADGVAGVVTTRDGIDTGAVHRNVNGEINSLTSKATPVAGDLILIEDSAASFAKKKAAWPTGGSGDVTAAANITDNVLVRGDGGAKGIQGSGVTLDDNNNMGNVRSIRFQAEHDLGSVSGSLAVDWSTNGPHKRVTLTNNVTSVTFTDPPGPCHLTLKIIHNFTGGADISGFQTKVKWPNSGVPYLTNASGAIDIISFYFDGTNYYGVAAINFGNP